MKIKEQEKNIITKKIKHTCEKDRASIIKIIPKIKNGKKRNYAENTKNAKNKNLLDTEIEMNTCKTTIIKEKRLSSH